MAGRDTSPTSTSSTLSCITVQTGEQGASRSSSTASPPMSTPPTSLGDEASVLSDAMKIEVHVETQEEPPAPRTQTPAEVTPQPTPEAPRSEGRRSARSSRASVVTYNVQILAGTAIHTPSKYLEKHHKNVLHGSLESLVQTNTASPPKKRGLKRDLDDSAEEQLASESAQAETRRKSSRLDLRKEALHNLTATGNAVSNRGGGLLSNVKSRLQNVLRIDMNDHPPERPLIPIVKPALKRLHSSMANETEDEATEKEQEKTYSKPKTKQWMKQGLFVGQHREFNPRFSESQNRNRRRSKKGKDNDVLPLPMFGYERSLNDPLYKRDFKLPFDVYHPLPRKIKVDGWVKLHKNRFIGDASALWKRDKQDSSQCYCDPDEGCGEDCHNRIMAYECDSTNCKSGEKDCGNRPFAQLKRRAKGNRYDYGVEVCETEDRGYGVRAMRCFDPFQIIVEYAGEIITQAECERRMKQVYKKDKCYYLMSFDNKMIIDATRGTIARFVNHSCEPNCEMIKWTVGGEPRMALFAGSRGIMTGEELTYDYNFDPFSQKNIQECHCGTESCRGILGPKPKHQPKEEKSMASTIIAGTKRKLQEALGMGSGSRSAPNSPKKRKILVNAAMTKKENARAEAVAARAKAAKKAEEEAAQLADRENRALRRSASMTMSSRRRIMRKGGRHSMPALKTTRRTTVSFKRQTPKSLQKAGAIKSARKPGFTSALKRKIPASKVTKRVSKPNTAVRESTPESESVSDSDDSPNITPASLRSANKNKNNNLTQTKLPFKPLNLNRSSSRMSDNLDFPDSEDEVEVQNSARNGKVRGKNIRFSGSGKAVGKGSLGSKGRASSSSSRHDLSSLQNLFSASS